MKKLLFILTLALVLTTASCQDKTIVGSTLTVAWDAPPAPLPAGVIEYEVVFQPRATGGTNTLVATTAALEQQISFVGEGQYRIGVRTKRTANALSSFSEFLWSDATTNEAPWYAEYFANPPKVKRVRIK